MDIFWTKGEKKGQTPSAKSIETLKGYLDKLKIYTKKLQVYGTQ